MNKCPYVLKRFRALKKRVTDFFDYNIFDSGKDLPEPRDVVRHRQKENIATVTELRTQRHDDQH